MKASEVVELLTPTDIIKLMEKLGIDRYEEKGGYIIFPTICHNIEASEASMKLYYYKNSHLFNCYTECDVMDIFGVFKHYYETRNINYTWKRDIFDVIVKSANINTKVEKEQEFIDLSIFKEKEKTEYVYPKYNKGVLSIYSKFYTPEWLSDGISPAAMDKFNILYSTLNNAIIIPHYDINDNLIGIRSRSLIPEVAEKYGKYLPARIEGKMYNHKLGFNLYGLNINKNNINEMKTVFVFEGEKSVLQLESFLNLPNIGVAVCGSTFTKHQFKLLFNNCDINEIVLCFDKEEEPNESDNYFYKLYNMCKKYSSYCNMSFIYDYYNVLDLKDSPTDRGEQTFKYLLKNRVKVRS